MQLKQYQSRVLEQLRLYLKNLSHQRQIFNSLVEVNPEVKAGYNFTKLAFEKTITTKFSFKKEVTCADGETVPNICFKVPTGGGKTLLACHAIDDINKIYLKQQTGLVLWIVPSNQIYKQTLKQLKDRDHWYRRILDISSGGRVLIKQKGDHLSPTDIRGNLVIMMLMLPSANRENKETLKMFQDSGGYTEFFPAEDNWQAHRSLLQNISNLEYYGSKDQLTLGGGLQVKTSLGNALRIVRPIIILDEGHKSYSEGARKTISGFNPSFILELSATPHENANKLVEITGKELNEEEMIKLDINLVNKATLDWKTLLLTSIDKRNQLEKHAQILENNRGTYIRPIMLIQVERTGKDQRGADYIHAEDVREYLIGQCNIAPEQVAVKSSEKDDIEGINLFSPDCAIRYIITKQALQEGWDCSFAYVLTILTNPKSSNALTQLIGRVLRQPYAKKTSIKELDECYVYTFRSNTRDLVSSIKKDLEKEGLGDISNRLVTDDKSSGVLPLKEFVSTYREKFKKFAGQIYLPQFVLQEKNSWRTLNYDVDILSRIDWTQIDLSEIYSLTLKLSGRQEQFIRMNLAHLSSDQSGNVVVNSTFSSLDISLAFLAQQLLDVVPNPFISYQLGTNVINKLLNIYDREVVASNYVYIIEKIKEKIESEKDRLAEDIFRGLVHEHKVCFYLIKGQGEFLLPSSIKVKSAKPLIRHDNSQIAKSLFDYVPEEGINELERQVAVCLDEQEQFLWWYRNMSKTNYHISGWKKNKIYPDFIVAKDSSTSADTEFDTVFVLETKGDHLFGNSDTVYKQNIFELCNALAVKKEWTQLNFDFPDRKFVFQVVQERDWQETILRLAQREEK